MSRTTSGRGGAFPPPIGARTGAVALDFGVGVALAATYEKLKKLR
jgi:hypothetical protein